MIEINFFEQKEKNMIPIIYTIVFGLGFLFVGLYIIGFTFYYGRQDNANMQRLTEINQEVVDARSREQVLTLVEETQSDLNQLVTERHPTIFLYNQVHEVFQDADETVRLYQFTVGETVYVELHNIDLDQAANYMVELRGLPFIDQVDLNSTYLNDGETYIAQFNLVVNEERLREEFYGNDTEDDA
jgi:hypothetical protein